MEDKFKTFNELVHLGGRFVADHNGVWDTKDWVKFLSDLYNNGIDLTDDMQCYLRHVVESMRGFYFNLGENEGVLNAMMNMSEHTVRLFRNTNGIWTQSEWEEFINGYQQNALSINQRALSQFNNILDSSKELFESIVGV